MSALVWSAVAPVSIPSSFVPSDATFLPSTLPLTTIFPVTFKPPEVASAFVDPANCNLLKSSAITVIETFAPPPRDTALPPPLLSLGERVKVVPLAV